MQIEAKIPSFRRIPIAILIVSLIGQLLWTRSVRAASEAYCRFNEKEILTKEQLLQSSLAKNSQAYQQYKTIIQRHGQL